MTENKHSKLWLYFSGIVFATLMAAFLISLILWIILYNFGIISINPANKHIPLVFAFAGSILIGAIIALFVGRLIIKPVQNISNAFGELSKGNFDIRVPDNQKISEISEMAKCFNSMAYDLSHIETLRNDFVVNVSHEFKTPIASIEGYATLLQDTGLSDEKRIRYTEKILDNSKNLSYLLTNILALSKLENQETVYNKKEYLLDEQLRRAVLLLEDKWGKKNIDFDIDLPKCRYFGNEQLLNQVWYNLIDNAIKNSENNSKIKIFLTVENASVKVSVSDNGCGMSDEVQKHIFEKFYQGDSSRKSEGNGLGLALVKRIVTICGGEITVKSQINCGSEFTVILPFEVK